MAPAGEMWSVVIESPSSASARAPLIGLNGFRLARHIDEERRLVDVGAAVIPLINVALGAGDGVPRLVAVEDVAVLT